MLSYKAHVVSTSANVPPSRPPIVRAQTKGHCCSCSRLQDDILQSRSDESLSSRRWLLAGVVSGLASLSMAGVPSAQALELVNKEVDDDASPWIQELRRRTEEKRDERREERLKNYYKRNFKEYFSYEASSPELARRRGIRPETQAAIAKWMEENKD